MTFSRQLFEINTVAAEVVCVSTWPHGYLAMWVWPGEVHGVHWTHLPLTEPQCPPLGQCFREDGYFPDRWNEERTGLKGEAYGIT